MICDEYTVEEPLVSADRQQYIGPAPCANQGVITHSKIRLCEHPQLLYAMNESNHNRGTEFLSDFENWK
jgi:hypothetical protein